jgi:hypothetical protein
MALRGAFLGEAVQSPEATFYTAALGQRKQRPNLSKNWVQELFQL